MTNTIADLARAETLSDILKSLAHPVRLRIVCALCAKDERVGDLADLLGEKQAIISQQLRILRMSSLVHVIKDNGVARYSLLEPRLKNLMECLDGCKGNNA